MSYKIIFTLATHYRWEIHQINIKLMFLHGDLDEEVYMKLPKSFTVKDDFVYRLLKILYKLK